MAVSRQLKLFNSLSRRIEPLQASTAPSGKATAPIKSFGFYFCGPTVYGRAHIGNFRSLVCADLLVRTLKAFGYPVSFVRNITDVDDKTIKGAQQEGISLADFTRKHEESFHKDCANLALLQPDKEPRATEHIKEMIALVQKLVAANHAYVADDGSVYYRIESFKNYGCLCHLDREGLRAGARVAQDEYEKESLADFVLWKKYRPEDGDVKWDSPWGPGRPGWHLECSAMSMKYLGESYELHGGGIDLLFPHHENEIAQSEGATGKPFVKHWWHVAHLLVDGRKMSKSLGNLYTLDDVEKKGFTGRELRYALMSANYRENLNFTWKSLEDAKEALGRLDNLSIRLHEQTAAKDDGKNGAVLPPADFENAILGQLANDLNISGALGELFTALRKVNAAMDDGSVGPKQAKAWIEALQAVDKVLGIQLGSISGASTTLLPEIQNLVSQRDKARASKDWSGSDRLRDELTKRGFLVEDTPAGTRVKPRR